MLRNFTKIITSLHHKLSKTTTTTRSFSSKTINFNKQQKNILKFISDGQSVFITGAAGTGKTFLLKEAIKLLRTKYKPYEVYVTASTGVAACHLDGGQTLHSFLGVSVGDDSTKEQILDRVYRNKRSEMRWKKAKALVIDEVSMVSARFFDSLEFIASNVKDGNGKIWGGIQLIASGDFFQLPPVLPPDNDDKEFAFEAQSWEGSFHMHVELTAIIRQEFDAPLMDLLHAVRKGRVDDNHIKVLQECCDTPMGRKASVPHIYPRKDDVERENDGNLRSLSGVIQKYTAVDKGDEPWISQLSWSIAPDKLELRFRLTGDVN